MNPKAKPTSHDMFCTCPDCIKIKGGISDVSKSAKPNVDDILQNVRDAGALDDNFGGEDWPSPEYGIVHIDPEPPQPSRGEQV